MNYKYHTVIETLSVDIDEEWVNILEDLDREIENNDHKERRHCLHIEANTYEGSEYGYIDKNIEALFEEPSLAERLPAAIAKLQPQQQVLVNRIFIKKEKKKDIAAEEGVSPAAITDRLRKIYKALEKNLTAGA
jgi:DNA-directed RNA polymerase specialized sigma subunit